MIVAVEPSTIAHLPAGLGIERCVVENDFTFLARSELLGALAFADDGQHFAVLGASLTIALKVGLRKLLVCGIGSLLGSAFPRGLGTFTLLFESSLEFIKIKNDVSIASCVLNKVEGKSKRVVKLKGVTATKPLPAFAQFCHFLRRTWMAKRLKHLTEFWVWSPFQPAFCFVKKFFQLLDANVESMGKPGFFGLNNSAN